MMGVGVGSGLAGMWIMGLLGLLTLAGVIVLIVWAIRTLIPANRSRVTDGSGDPLTQLQLRLARGDITPDEYEELRSHLRD